MLRRVETVLLLAALAACSRSQPPAVAGVTQPLFSNGGFESGSIDPSWTVTVLWNNGITYPPQSYADLNLQSCAGHTPGGTPDCTNRTSAKGPAATETQQMAGLSGLVSPRWPKFGQYSAVVNEQGFRQNANSLKQRYTTTSADVDPSDGKIHCRFALSPQLQNPGHVATQQPYFYAILRNVTKGTTLYQTFNYSNEAGVPWQTYAAATPVLYTDWVVFDIAPGNAALWVGDTIEIEVVAAGCSPSGHWGQVYVDGFGALLPSLSITGSAPQWVAANANLTYTFDAENTTSLVVRNAVATEILPANTTFVSVTPSAGVTCTAPAAGTAGTGLTGGPSVVCQLGWMNPSSSASFQVTVHTNSGLATNTSITNGNYSIQGDGISPILGAKVITTIGNGPYADLGVTVTDGLPAVVKGGQTTYTITASNSGPTAVATASLVDAFPASLTGVTWTCTGTGGGSCSRASGVGNITAGNGGTLALPVGATATFVVTATIDPATAATVLANTVTISPPGGINDPSSTNNADTDLDSIGSVYALTVTKDLGETGQGQVISSPAAISCGNACPSQSASFLDGAQVTLTAIARAGDAFDHWSGGCIGTANVCTVTLSGAPLAVAAHFRGPTVTGSVAAGSGSIACAPSPATQRTSSTCTISPLAGWQLTALVDNAVSVIGSVSTGTYSLSGGGLVSDHSVVATFMKSNATACGAGTECASGTCVDGVCCNVACGGQCQACIVPGHEGTCWATTGAPLGGRASCTSDGSACGGACDGTNVAACAYPGGGTTCRAASCAAGVATLVATCAGTGSCPAIQTSACAPYVCGPTACFTSCSGDAQCVSGDYCGGGACVPKLGNGTVCSAANQCSSGNCVDGVCCGTACSGQCEACSVGGHVGTCWPVMGAPVGGRGACATDGSACGGTCNGTNNLACTYPGASSPCRAASCAAGTGVLAASCDGAGACPAQQTQACAPYACGPTACFTSCSGDAQCVAGDYCSGGACVPKLGNGQACTVSSQCAFGNCVDGVCCDGGCSGQCEACNVAGHLGECTAVSGAPVGGRGACTADGSACGGSCDGATRSACAYPSVSTSCRSASCADGTATAAATCDGAGRCPSAQTQACAPYVCDAAACFATCSADGQCAAGSWCSGGSCVPQLANGQTCTAAGQCATGHCVDGVCCESACDGQCEACSLSGDGTCTAVTGAPAGSRAACATDGTICGGACDGTRRNVCTYPSDGTSCRAPSCSTGVATVAAACDGAGSCPAVQTQACAPYACGATSCLATCSSESDCAAGEWCAAGVCTDRYAAGHSCGADVQCGSGHCTDGVCCDLACNGQCEACNVDGHVGECVAVSGAPVGGLRPACTSDGTACGGACDGAHRTACGYPQGSCRDASCAGGVATLAASCDGGGHCPAPQTQPCAPYVCGATACANGCAIDGDCAAGNWCAGGVCSALLTDGQTCSASTQCAHGHCVDGVCCDVACGGQCEACNLPGPLLGTCSPVSGAPVNGRTQCTSDGTACGGACDGADRAACAYPDASVVCRAASCAAGVAVVSAACDGAGSCPSPQQQTCAPNVCGATACASGCTSDLGCAAGYWCAAGVCAPKNGPGTACSGASQCTSGNCVDGVCCDGACSGKCEACDVPGHVGACTAVTGAPHGGARGTCPSDGTACGGSCDGAARTACSFPGTTTVCRAATCAGGVATGAASCDGGGACGATPSPIACGAYACAGDACATSCTTSADCASGLVCESATCVAPGSAGGWRLAGSGGCSATGGADLGALALLALLLAPAAARRRRGRAGVLLALALALPGAARAQSTAFDAQRFQPLGGARDVLAIPTASVPGHLEARAGVFLDYASQPLRLTGPRTVVLVDSQTDLTLTGSIGLLDRFEVSLAFPIIVQLDGKPASDASAALPASRPRQGVGDLRITPRALLLALGPLRLAAAVPVTLPTGTSAYAGQSGVTASPLAVAEWGDERGVRVAANVGVALRKRERLADLDQGSAFAFGAGGAVPFRVAGERLAGLATLTGEVGGGAVERPVELLGALRWAGRRGVEVTVGGGRGLTQGYGMPRYRFLAMVDLAGVSLRRTAREPVAEAAPPPAAPEPPPAPTPVPVAAPQPAPAPVAVPPAVVAVAPPPGPCEAGQQHAPEQCPDLDDDGDGIPNGKDRCPLLAGVPEHQGCPPPRAVLTAKRIEITEAVFFDSGKDVIQPRSFQLLDDVARILEDHAEVKVVSIEGHTDASGAAARNQLLSERRAAAVKVYLVRKGIAPERLAARGFGSARPVAKEVDAGSKAKNRRVEFLVKP